ncbi:MAG: hypothetical protein CL967_02105 [Euryarchaeota archaeon]|nr:hypothetical protein [Euryarchaeota archaeon]|tara:strand:+ start:950 stop:1411 length:462 start_codon:yes stop_codon:yes gene_type:complete
MLSKGWTWQSDNMDDKTYTVEIADATGHSEVQMTKKELIDHATHTKGRWIFVDNRMVATEELAAIDLSTASHIRSLPSLQAGRDEKKYCIEIADSTGHSEVLMTKSEIIEHATNTKGRWVFVDNRMVSASDLANVDFDSAQHIRSVPSLQAGL